MPEGKTLGEAKEKAYRAVLDKLVIAFKTEAANYPKDVGITGLAEVLPKVLKAIDKAATAEEIDIILNG